MLLLRSLYAMVVNNFNNVITSFLLYNSNFEYVTYVYKNLDSHLLGYDIMYLLNGN